LKIIIIEIRKKIKKLGILSRKPDPRIFDREIILFYRSVGSVTKVTIKCKFCENTDHLSKNCPNFKDFCDDLCIICLGPNHKISECPLRKCLKCNQIGHSAKTCDPDNTSIKCTKCQHVGHSADDCLIYPSDITNEIIEENICVFCNKKGHFVCPIKKDFFRIGECNEEIYVSSEDSDDTESASPYDENSNLEGNSVINEDFSKPLSLKIFCPQCAEEHDLKDCDNGSSDRNRRDDLRKKFSKMYFSTSPSKLAQDNNFIGDDSF
jgi:hypothetical protein